MADQPQAPKAPAPKDQNDPTFAKQTPSVPGERKPDSKRDLEKPAR